MAEAALEFAALSPDRAMTWAELRHELWPATSAADHVREAGYLQRSRDYFVLLAIESGVVGFAEAVAIAQAEREAEALRLRTAGVGPIIVDYHAETTSEKIAMGRHLDGKVSAVFGTHTHVQTADETVLAGGTAYITDVGMCGPRNSVLGMDRNIIVRRFRTGLPEKFEVANEPGVISGVVICVEKVSGRAKSIERISVID